MNRYSLSDYLRDFGNERACLEYLTRQRWPDGITCAKCQRKTRHHLSLKRKRYYCQDCGAPTFPTAGTIFHKSRTPLPIWFFVFFQMAQTRCGVAAKEIERQTGVTYKTAWRLCQLVRASLQDRDETAALFSGVVEVDEVYMGSRKPRRKGQRKSGRGTIHGTVPKVPVVGIVERDEEGMPVRVRARVTEDVTRATVLPFIEETVAPGSRVYTDEYGIYEPLGGRGYRHDFVRHKAKQYAYEAVDDATGEVHNVHTNAIEGFWSQVKGGVLNVHRGVSARYLQRYVDEFAFRFSHAKGEEPMFLAMVSRAACSGRHAARLP
jgi:transposase